MMHRVVLLELLDRALPSKDVRPLLNHIADYITYLTFPPGGEPNTFSPVDAYNELNTLIKQLDDVRFMLDRIARPFEYELREDDGYFWCVVFSRIVLTGERIEIARSEATGSRNDALMWGDYEVIKRMEELTEMKMKGAQS